MNKNHDKNNNIYRNEWNSLYNEFEGYLKEKLDNKNNSFSISELEKEIKILKNKSVNLISNLISDMITEIDQTEMISQKKGV